MTEKNPSLFEKMSFINNIISYRCTGCCKLLLASFLILAICLVIMLTPSNPIFKAAYEGNLDTIRNYLKEGGGINAVDKWNNTALHWAAKGGQYEVMQFLVDNGISIDAVNEQGDNALHWSVYSNNKTIIEYLVMNRVNVNSRNFENETPLHYAIMLNAFKSAQVLLHLHADPNVVAKNGNAALHYLIPGCSEDEQCRNLIEEFKSAGADFTIENNNHHTVMQVVFSRKVNATSPFEEGEL